MKDRLKNINIPLLLIALILLFYIFAYGYNRLHDSMVVKSYKDEIKKEDTKALIEKAKEYNQNLYDKGEYHASDVFSDDGVKEVNLLNADKPLGIIEIPTVGIELPIYEGTSEKQLQIGAGHLIGTSLPAGGINTRSVITAHRGLVTKRMFRDLDKLKKGDVFIIDTYGEKKAYEVYEKVVVLPHDTSSISIIKDKDIATLLTCEPYIKNTHRLLVNGKRVKFVENANDSDYKIITDNSKKIVKKQGWIDFFKNLSFNSLVDIEYILFILLILIIIPIIYLKRRKKGRKIYDKENI